MNISIFTYLYIISCLNISFCFLWAESFSCSVLAEIAFFLLFPPSFLFKLGGNVTFSLFPSSYSLNKSSAVTSF